MTQENDDNRIIDLSEPEEEEEDLEDLDQADAENENGEAADADGAEASGETAEAGKPEEPEAIKPELKIVIRLDGKITVGIQKKDTYPLFYTLDETDIDALGEPITKLVQEAEAEWSRRPELNKYEPKGHRPQTKVTLTTARPARAKQQATTQSGPKLI